MGIKGFLNKVGLVEDDAPVAKGKPAQTGQVAAPTPAPAYTSLGGSYQPSNFSAPTIDPSIQEMLAQSLEENKLAGFDYLKFISAVEETKSTGVAEDARFKMTFSTAKQLGVNKNDLLKSGQHYIDVLGQDETDFNAELDQYEKTQIKSREAKMASISSTITSLNAQLSQLNQEMGNLALELQSEKTKLDTRKSSFRVTLESFRSTIKANVDKINQYL